MSSNVIKLPPLLERLGSMTAIRDTELLEQSLLKTLGAVLGVSDVSLYKTDEYQRCVGVLNHHRSVVLDREGVERVTERIETIYQNVQVPAPELALMENVRLTHKPSTWHTGENTLVVLPLMNTRRLCGHIAFRKIRGMTDTENAIVQGVLEVYANYYSLLDDSQRDQLTGLYNRHALDTGIERMWPLLAQHGKSQAPSRRRTAEYDYWLAMLDIDHFKQVNDTHGHVVGDEILLLVSRMVADCFRKSDLIYRYGGEEFLIITSAASEADVLDVMERVRLRIEGHRFPQVGQVTVSLGVARIDAQYSAQEIIARADRTLYQAKRDGRNRTYCHDLLQSEGSLPTLHFGSAELF
jgi:diguanylate cyclase (GGDEF)-like protein